MIQHLTQRLGLKGQIESVLKSRAMAEDAQAQTRTGLTLGQIGAALGLEKTRHGELSAALVKARDEGKIRFETGPRSGTLGPRFVKRYRWALRLEKMAA